MVVLASLAICSGVRLVSWRKEARVCGALVGGVGGGGWGYLGVVVGFEVVGY